MTYINWIGAKVLSNARTPAAGVRRPYLDREACVRADYSGRVVAIRSAYYEKRVGPATAAKPLTRDEARRIAANIAKLPGLLRKP